MSESNNSNNTSKLNSPRRVGGVYHSGTSTTTTNNNDTTNNNNDTTVRNTRRVSFHNNDIIHISNHTNASYQSTASSLHGSGISTTGNGNRSTNKFLGSVFNSMKSSNSTGSYKSNNSSSLQRSTTKNSTTNNSRSRTYGNTTTGSGASSVCSSGSNGSNINDSSGTQQYSNSNSNSHSNSQSKTNYNSTQIILKKLLYTKIWNYCMLVFTILLLFGSQTRDLIVIYNSYWIDILFDVIFTNCFLYFTLDILIRLYVNEDNYFNCFVYIQQQFQNKTSTTSSTNDSTNRNWFQRLCSCCSSSQDNNNSNNNNNGTNRRNKTILIRSKYGSFVFWCDLISTITVLYEISYINPFVFSEIYHLILINKFGLSSNGIDMSQYGQYGRPIQVNNIDLLISIGKTARMARFIRSSNLVQLLSSKINWYYLLNLVLVNPIFYYQLLFVQCYNNGCSNTLKDIKHNLFCSTSTSTSTSNTAPEETTTNNTTPATTAPTRTDSKKNMKIIAKINHYDNIMSGSLSMNSVSGITSPTNNNNNNTTTRNTKTNTANTTIVSSVDPDISTTTTPTGSKSNTNNNNQPNNNESQVGSAMREATSQRIAFGIIVSLLLTVLFTYTEQNTTRPSTMIVLHSQTKITTTTTSITDTDNDNTARYISMSLDAARMSSIPDLFSFQITTGSTSQQQQQQQQTWYFDSTSIEQPEPKHLRPREILQIECYETISNISSIGRFNYRNQRKKEALVSLLYTLFIVLVWIFGVTAFAGPVMVLVVIPIEQMVKLLSMLMIDPLGYQSTPTYIKFVNDSDKFTNNTRWSKEVLKGMETSFLMSTILRIGNLMQVGFGSAGVEIIRQNLQKSQSSNMSLLNSQGSIVSCIFLFCDVRNFTDATESLQEEVFVFTNSIAAVVHSHCASLGGSANKNVGDAFLLSWLLDNKENTKTSRNNNNNHDDDEDDNDNNREDTTYGNDGDFKSYSTGGQNDETFCANSNQADKCLLAVIRICMALQYDEYYLDALTPSARKALKTKLQNRPGHIVQMGIGVHAGKAVQGAIGSQRKIDATYVSEAVERSEFLESSTKKYGVKMLMSDSFHRLLDQRNKRRCRKIDQILLRDDEDGDGDDDDDDIDRYIIDLLTYDMDIDALGSTDYVQQHFGVGVGGGVGGNCGDSDGGSGISGIIGTGGTGLPTGMIGTGGGATTTTGGGTKNRLALRPSFKFTSSITQVNIKDLESISDHVTAPDNNTNNNIDVQEENDHNDDNNNNNNNNGGTGSAGGVGGVGILGRRTNMRLVLPSGPALYNQNVWVTDEMRIIRQLYSDGIFFQKFSDGLQSFYNKDWDHATRCFTTILSSFEDGPSRYFLNQIEQYNGKPPRDFQPYGIP